MKMEEEGREKKGKEREGKEIRNSPSINSCLRPCSIGVFCTTNGHM